MESRQILRALALGLASGLALAGGTTAGTYDISVDRVTFDVGGVTRAGIGYNGSNEPIQLRFEEGEEVEINVTNNLSESTSIHWHGLILPYDQDGVPGISYNGIAPGETFTYRFPIVQNGTYWFHSHTGLQEPNGAFGALVIAAKEREPFRYDREYVVLLSDLHPHSGERVMRNLKQMPDYYNRQQRTLLDFLDDASEEGLDAALADRSQWGEMRMMPTDIEDVHGYRPLINGKAPEAPWTAAFAPGERIRLRFVNASAMAYFDVRIPGLDMTVVAADGNNVTPVRVEEFRIAVAETYDVIVRPTDPGAFNILAESVGRVAMARGVLTSDASLAAPDLPALREPPLLTMADMALDPAMAGMHDEMAMADMDHSAMGEMKDEDLPPGAHRMPDGTIMGGPGEDPFYAGGSGLTPTAADGGKFLTYSDLKAAKPLYPDREATREIELRLTGNMERYMWSINGVKYEDADPIVLQYGERVRFKFVNETMMAHPMHLHGMWSIIDTGSGERDPIKHVVSVNPGTVVYMETEVDAPGQWAFHCHLMYHHMAGMMRKVVVEGGPETAPAPALTAAQHG
ncbi:MAG: copper resistance system multicopper oxidase [Pikeienuella sp.]|uniref:copper resistance system multicopper oxidase n=1 Tax=Pikeienuella sp. TaxID=2831957 RepID=UPI00391DFEDF